MSKVGTPGTERLLYQEAHNGSRFFNAITYAKIGTSFFGYFVVNNSATHTSVIKRVPLAGGAATTIVTSPRYISTRDLVTDGLTLYWADEGGLRRSPIGGGGVTTLFAGTSLLSVGLDASRVYFSSGTQVRSIAKFGGLSTLVASGTSVVAALNVQRTTPTSIFWAERNGSVRGRFVGGFGVTYQEPSTTGRRASSVSVTGSRIFWTDCAFTLSDCRARARNGSVTVSVPAGSLADDAQGDASAMFWGDGLGVRKYRN